MIITVDTIRKYRPIANNIRPNDVEIYIREAERLDIMPAIGVDLYMRYSQLGKIEVDGGDNLQDEDNVNIHALQESDLTPEEHKMLNGGFYEGPCGMKRIEGVKAALAYLAYARFVRNHPTQVTAFGVVQKIGDDSNAASDRVIASASKDAERIGFAYLQECQEFWHQVQSCCKSGMKMPRKRFKAIGE